MHARAYEARTTIGCTIRRSSRHPRPRITGRCTIIHLGPLISAARRSGTQNTTCWTVRGAWAHDARKQQYRTDSRRLYVGVCRRVNRVRGELKTGKIKAHTSIEQYSRVGVVVRFHVLRMFVIRFTWNDVNTCSDDARQNVGNNRTELGGGGVRLSRTRGHRSRRGKRSKKHSRARTAFNAPISSAEARETRWSTGEVSSRGHWATAVDVAGTVRGAWMNAPARFIRFLPSGTERVRAQPAVAGPRSVPPGVSKEESPRRRTETVEPRRAERFGMPPACTRHSQGWHERDRHLERQEEGHWIGARCCLPLSRVQHSKNTRKNIKLLVHSIYVTEISILKIESIAIWRSSYLLRSIW